jgi:hypothetical protein
MLSIGSSRVCLCEGLSRREWLRAGGLPLLGLTLPDLLHARDTGASSARARTAFGRAKSCIVAFLFGAPAHQDIWDLKPQAPAEIRGEFRPIASSVPGMWLGEHIPKIARQAHRLALIRSVTHPDNTHTIAMHYMLTGHRHAQPNTNPQNQSSDFPTFGSVIERMRPGHGLPAGISLNAPANQVAAGNHIFPGFFAGFLGRAYDPFFVSQDPSHADFRPMPALEGIEAANFGGRRSLLQVIECKQRALQTAADVRNLDALHARAIDLLTTPMARRAFDLSREPRRLRDRYGWSAFGHGLLLARRLVEAGVGLITVNWARDDAFWDTHAQNFRQLKNDLLPRFDMAFSTLLEDLDERGLLDETLVVCLGEFGRTPRINAQAGRDHWAACNTVVLAGGGIRGGQIHGASDRWAAYPVTSPVSPEDLAATLYHAMGIDCHTTLRDQLHRPLPLSTGTPLVNLFC